VTREFDAHSLTFPWAHANPDVDGLQLELARMIGVKLSLDRADMFARIWDLAHQRAKSEVRRRPTLVARAAIPYLNEPWYC